MIRKLISVFDDSLYIQYCNRTTPGRNYYLQGYTFAPVPFQVSPYVVHPDTDIYSDRRFTRLMGEDFQEAICYLSQTGYRHIELEKLT